jgi:hypothetical protein
MLSLRLLAALAVVGLASCTGCTRFYWRYECGRVGAVMTPVVVNHTSGGTDVTPIGGTLLPRMPSAEANGFTPPEGIRAPRRVAPQQVAPNCSD